MFNTVLKNYTEWVISHPENISDVESTLKWLSYLITSQYGDSIIIPELVYSVSNLLVLYNDKILGTSSQDIRSYNYHDNMKICLTVLEYSEVFAELSAKKLYGNRGKWFVILMVQLVKCFIRLKLLYSQNEYLLRLPPLTSLDRKQIPRLQSNGVFPSRRPTCIQLSTGRKIRINDVRSLSDWSSRLSIPFSQGRMEDVGVSSIMAAETLYIVKPLIHLMSMYYWKSERKWKPWIISFAIDITCLHIANKYKGEVNLNRGQRLELNHRKLNLLLYLLRSPFYDKASKDIIRRTLSALSNNLPLVRYILNPINEYIPLWQRTYFYMWSS